MIFQTPSFLAKAFLKAFELAKKEQRSGQIVAVEAYIEDIGGVAMINQSHNLIRTFAGNRLYKPSIIGHASNGWGRLKDAQHMIHQFTGR